MTWKSGRPIYNSLPKESEQYHGNQAVDALTLPYDKLLMQYKSYIQNFYTNYLDPDTALSANLDWLAQLCGFTGEYWDHSWTDTQKRKLIKYSHLFIWANKGTERLLLWLLNDVFNLDAKIYRVGDFIVGQSVTGDELGGMLLEYYIILGLNYETTSPNWRLAERLNRLYMPCFCDSDVVYDGFYAGFSEVGDPIL